MRRHLLILVALIVALGGVAVLAVMRQPTLGLDLQGGLEVVLEARPEQGRELTQEDLDRAKEIIEERVNKTGVSEPEIRKQGDNQISVSLPGVHDTARAARLIGQTATLEFYNLQGDALSPTLGAQGQIVASPQLLPLLSGQQELAKKGTPTAWYLYGSKKERLAGPADTRQEILQQLPGGKAPEGSKFYAVPEGRTILTCNENARLCPGVGVPNQEYYYLFKYQPNNAEETIPELTGEDLNGSGTRVDFQNNQPIVTLDFTNAGGDKFHEITRELAQRGRAQANLNPGVPEENFNQSFAIVLDGEIRSFPSIDFNNLPDGISGGQAIIEGLDNLEEAEDLALVLQTGALPVEFVQVERSDISATLGEDSLREAIIAGVAGLIAVAFFLLIFYRFLGVIAIIGLAIYGALLYGAILIFDVTLTLPGIAGLVLTIGVAADANVVIFERIKEEVRAGKSVRAAIAGGYNKGFNTIIDANVVTMITAFVLYAVATSGVKGFALMLLVGTLLSMVTAVAATRALLGLLAGFRWFNNPAFMGATAQKIPAWQRIDFVGRAKLWFAISGAVIAIGIGSLIVQGLNLGIDFRGGSQITFETPQATSVEEVRQEAAEIGRADAIIQGRGEIQNGGYRQFTLKTESLSAGAQIEPAGRSANAARGHLDRRQERVGELQRADPARRDPRDHRLARAHRHLRDAALRVQVLAAGARRAPARHPHHARPLLADRPRDDGGDRGGDPDDPRLLDLRHDHHLRPRAREHSAHAAVELRRDREPVAVGDDQAIAGDVVHHAASDRFAAPVRRRHAQGLRLRAARRHHLGRVLDHLHRGAAPGRPQGARARVRQAQGSRAAREDRRCRRARARGSRAEEARRRRRRWTSPSWPPSRRPATETALPRRPQRGARRAASAGARGLMAERAESVRQVAARFRGRELPGGRRRRRADEGARRRARRRAGRQGEADARGRARARRRHDGALARRRPSPRRARGSTLSGVFREVGLVTRREYEELELRLAQLEHRLRLVERQPTPLPAPRP